MDTKYCKGCTYQGYVGCWLICDYIGITGHKRPCKFGKDCTVRTELKRNGNIVAIDGTKLEQIITEHGMTLSEFAHKIGMRLAQLRTTMKRGTCEKKTARRFAAGLDCKVREFTA